MIEDPHPESELTSVGTRVVCGPGGMNDGGVHPESRMPNKAECRYFRVESVSVNRIDENPDYRTVSINNK